MNLVLVPLLLLLFSLIILAVRGTRIVGVNRYIKLKWVLEIYLALMLIAIPVLYLLPREGFAGLSNPQHQGPEFPDILDAIKHGSLEQTKGLINKGSWSLAYSNQSITVVNQMGVMIVARHKDTDDGKIDAHYYVASTALDGVDYADKLKTPILDISGNTLSVSNAGTYEIRLARFVRPFTLNQFLPDFEQQFPVVSGQETLLYLNIPKSLQLDNPEGTVKFVDEFSTQ